MTLQRFLTVTAEISERDLRPALALALGTGVPRDRQGYARFYHRVLEILDSPELTRLSESKALDPRRPAFHSLIPADSLTRERSFDEDALQGCLR